MMDIFDQNKLPLMYIVSSIDTFLEQNCEIER